MNIYTVKIQISAQGANLVFGPARGRALIGDGALIGDRALIFFF